MHPVERTVQEGFKRRAQARLASRPDLTVIAITGSYGKTSTKFAIAEVLRQRFNTLATPASFNTPKHANKTIAGRDVPARCERWTARVSVAARWIPGRWKR